MKQDEKNFVLMNVDMFVSMSGFYNPLAHTHFNMFVDEWTNANESPGDGVGWARVGSGAEVNICSLKAVPYNCTTVKIVRQPGNFLNFL